MAASFKTKVIRFGVPLPDFDEFGASYCRIGITRSIGDIYESPRSQGDATRARIEVRLSEILKKTASRHDGAHCTEYGPAANAAPLLDFK